MSKMLDSRQALESYVEEYGMLPLFKNAVPGFSVREMTEKEIWWTENERTDPWYWREWIAERGRVVYGKFFGNKAGFVSKALFPVFAAYRRNSMDFIDHFEAGRADRKEKLIMDVLENVPEIDAAALKKEAGLGTDIKWFDRGMTLLQMKTYAISRRFKQKTDRYGKPYGWAQAVFQTPEALFGEDYVCSAYDMPREECRETLKACILNAWPTAQKTEIDKLIGR